jgi:DNA oxidative demethylase
MTVPALFDFSPGERPRHELAPGAVHVPSWLTAGQQRWIVARFHEWTRGPVPIRSAKVRGHEMSVQTVCLGWHWQPYKYTREATDVNGKRVLPFPEWKDERSAAPVVSLSVGDSCTFRFGNPRDRGQPYEDVLLASGDLFVFGGTSRLAYHGVTKVHPGTAPASCGLREGRINITMRATGLD